MLICTVLGWYQGSKQRIFKIATPWRGFIAKLFPFDLLTLAQLLRTLISMRPDLVHIHAKTLYLSAVVSAKLLRIPVLITLLDYWYICPRFNFIKQDGSLYTNFQGPWCYRCFQKDMFSSPISRLIPTTVIRIFTNARFIIFDFFLRHIDRYIALTESSKKILVDYGLTAEKIGVVNIYI